jgi:hypothetical protein
MRRQRSPASEEEMTTIMRRQTPSVQTVKAQCTPTVNLQIGDSLVRLTAHQARQLASVLAVHADAVALARTELADSFLVDGWIAKPSSFRGGTHRKVLIACRASKVMLRAAKPNRMSVKVSG